MAERRAPGLLGRLALLLGALVAATGCAAVPTSGPVEAGRAFDVPEPPTTVRFIPQPPQPGASPEDVVRGFLLASTSYEDDYEAARLFLGATSRPTWRADAGVRIVAGTRPQNLGVEGGDVVLRVAQVAEITADGRHVPLAEPRPLEARFEMVQENGEWRIGGLDDGLVLTTATVRNSYRELDVFFLDPQRQVLVPDPVLLPQRDNLATVLTDRVLRGPTSWVEPGVVTAFPAGTALDLPSVPVRDGVAQVDLNAVARSASPTDRQAMSAQLVWTLRQLPEVTFLRLTVGQQDFPVRGVSPTQSRESWPDFDPASLPLDAAVYAVRDGVLGALRAGEFTAVPGPAGTGAVPLARPSVSVAGAAVAGVGDGGATVYAGPLDADAVIVPVLSGGNLARPSWDRSGALWTVDRSVGTGTVRVLPRDRDAVDVPVDGLAPGERVREVRVSRDGTRAVLVLTGDDGAGQRLGVGVVARGEAGQVPARITGLTPVAPEISGVVDVAWVDAARVAVLSDGADGLTVPQLHAVNGYAPQPEHDPIDALTISGAPGPRPLVVGTTGGEVAEADGRRWRIVGAGTSPTYPG